MAYDEELAARIRTLAAGAPAVSEKGMFGGLAFLVGGNMAIAASGQGGLLVRVDPEESDALARRAGVETMVMRGRSMRGWLHVDAAAIAGDGELAEWVGRGIAFARTLPPK